MLTGTQIAAAASALADYPITSLGMNCATGPSDMAENVAWLSHNWPRHVSVLPNAGIPTLVQGRTSYPLGPEPFAEAMMKFVREQRLSIVGGCCGTTPRHIEALVRALDGVKSTGREPTRGTPISRGTPVPPLVPSTTSLYEPV